MRWTLRQCPECDLQFNARKRLVWHLHSVHGASNRAIADLMGYQLHSIGPLLSLVRREQEATAAARGE